MKLHQTFRLDETIIEAANKFAATENRTLSNVYETAVIEYLKARGKLSVGMSGAPRWV